MDREEYEKDLRRRQAEHLKRVHQRGQPEWQPCMHDNCPECVGTGVKADGTACVHMISCPCPKCRPYSMVFNKAPPSFHLATRIRRRELDRSRLTANIQRMNRVLHTLWGKAKDNPGYVKREWMELQTSMERAKKALQDVIRFYEEGAIHLNEKTILLKAREAEEGLQP